MKKNQITMYVSRFDVEETHLRMSENENFEETFEELQEEAHTVDELQY
jgi:hypothetical protein